MAALAAQCESAPAATAGDASLRAEGEALALEVGGVVAVRWRVAVIRAVMADPPDGDAVRELYGELVDRHRDDAEILAGLRPLGDEIRRREADGSLPSAMVARSDRRSRRLL